MKAFYSILLALLAVRLVLMTVVPVFEPSEARYAAIAANMARTGDFVVPRFTYECEYQSFDGKPPLVFQAGGVCCKVMGVGRVGQAGRVGQDSPYALQLAVRIFPLLSAVLVLAILFHAVKLTADREAANLAVGICATCIAFYAAAGMALTDMTLTCCTAGALLMYECFQTTGLVRYAAVISLLLGAGMIVKGPVALVMFGLPVLVDAIVNKRWKSVFNRKWLWVAPIFVAVSAPWFVLIEQRNPGAVWYFFYNENFMRFLSHDYGDKYGAGREAFRGVSVLWALVATLPWVLLPVWEGVRGVRGLRGLRNLVRQFDMIAVLAIVGFWCLTSRVLLYYLFPMIPLFAAALAKNFDRKVLGKAFPWCAGVSLGVVAVTMVGGMLYSKQMRGAATPFELWENHYAHEFYHGTKSEEELAKCRETRSDQWNRLMEKAKAEGVAK